MKTIKLLLIVVAGFVIAACTHGSTSSDTEYQTAMNNADNDSASSYGVGSTKGYSATDTSNSRDGLHVNSLRAPSNQVYYFSFDSNQVHASDVHALTIQADYLASHPHAKIRLEGNTDNRGSREYNVGLGWRRDNGVERYLLQRGVRKSQIQMVSYGKEHPVAIGNNTKAWTKNRRVNLVYKVT